MMNTAVQKYKGKMSEIDKKKIIGYESKNKKNTLRTLFFEFSLSILPGGLNYCILLNSYVQSFYFPQSLGQEFALPWV